MSPTARTTSAPMTANRMNRKDLQAIRLPRLPSRAPRPAKSAKRIEFFRREDDARRSGVGLDAGGKATLNGPKVPYNGWKYSVSVADLMRDFMLPTSPRAYSHGESLPQVLPARMSLGCGPREENDRSHLALLTAKRFSSTNPACPQPGCCSQRLTSLRYQGAAGADVCPRTAPGMMVLQDPRGKDMRVLRASFRTTVMLGCDPQNGGPP